MYSIVVVALIATIVFTFVLMAQGFGAAAFFVDAPTLILLILITVPFLVASGTFKDFLNAFPLGITGKLKKRAPTLTELKKASHAVRVAIVTMFAGAGFSTVISLILLLSNIVNFTAVAGQAFAVLLLSFGYACLVTLMLIPLKARIDHTVIQLLSAAETEENA